MQPRRRVTPKKDTVFPGPKTGQDASIPPVWRRLSFKLCGKDYIFWDVIASADCSFAMEVRRPAFLYGISAGTLVGKLLDVAPLLAYTHDLYHERFHAFSQGRAD